MYEFLLAFMLILSPVYAESIPDYQKPFAPIFTDKPVYSWTDKIIVSVHAPSWNSNPNQIDSIGQSESHPIKISSGENFLKPYRLPPTSTPIDSNSLNVISYIMNSDTDPESSC